MRSRCQQVVFQWLPTDYVADRLKTIRPQAHANIARNAHVELTLETLFIRLAEVMSGETHRAGG